MIKPSGVYIEELKAILSWRFHGAFMALRVKWDGFEKTEILAFQNGSSKNRDGRTRGEAVERRAWGCWGR